MPGSDRASHEKRMVFRPSFFLFTVPLRKLDFKQLGGYAILAREDTVLNPG